jgi:hypothetical protein
LHAALQFAPLACDAVRFPVQPVAEQVVRSLEFLGRHERREGQGELEPLAVPLECQRQLAAAHAEDERRAQAHAGGRLAVHGGDEVAHADAGGGTGPALPDVVDAQPATVQEHDPQAQAVAGAHGLRRRLCVCAQRHFDEHAALRIEHRQETVVGPEALFGDRLPVPVHVGHQSSDQLGLELAVVGGDGDRRAPADAVAFEHVAQHAGHAVRAMGGHCKERAEPQQDDGPGDPGPEQPVVAAGRTRHPDPMLVVPARREGWRECGGRPAGVVR